MNFEKNLLTTWSPYLFVYYKIIAQQKIANGGDYKINLNKYMIKKIEINVLTTLDRKIFPFKFKKQQFGIRICKQKKQRKTS